MKKKLTLIHSLLWIVCSTLIVNSLAYLGIKGYLAWGKKYRIDPATPIQAIVQTGPQKEALKTAYLAELLDLSSDQPTLISQFDCKQAQEKILRSPVIKEAEVKLSGPGILYIDYTTRQPVALLYDFENIALDQKGYPFPVIPFFSPKKLPEIYLGNSQPLEWNQPLKGEKIALAFDLLKMLTGPIIEDLFNIVRIDVSRTFKKSCGQREIVLLVEDEIFASQKGQEVRFIFPRLLRLSTKKYPQELSNYLKLREQLLEKEKRQLIFPEEKQNIVRYPCKIIDFRIPQLAFIDGVENGLYSNSVDLQKH